MKVLLLFPQRDGQTGCAIQYAFEQLGHEVLAVDAKLEPENSYTTACHFRPDLVFCSRTWRLAEEVKKIKERFKDVIACMWNVDTRRNINKWERLFPLIRVCDYHFIVDEGTIPQWRKELNKNTYWLPEGLQIELHSRPEMISEEDREKYSCDVCWIGHRKGSNHKFRNEFLNAVEEMGVNFKQWGCRGMPKVWGEEWDKAVYLSKINIACSMCPENGKYCSQRNYIILGGGGFFLELYRDGLDEIFPSGIFDYYTSPRNLVEKVRYWLEHEEKRKEFAERGYKWVRKNATFTHRMKMALDYMRELNG